MYSAIVSKINTRPHPNADKLQIGLVNGNQVIVGLDTQNGELGVFFGSDGQLSEEFCKEHDLVAIYDGLGKKVSGGYFSDNRRVRAQKLRGEVSDGFWCPLSWFEYTGAALTTLKEGDEFTELNGNPICNKYETPATRRAAKQNGQNSAKGVKLPKVSYVFPEHFDTLQFRKVYPNQIPLGSKIVITAKLHGTSARYAHTTRTTRHAWPWYKRWGSKLLGIELPQSSTEWAHIQGSRKVILDKDRLPGHHINIEPDFRTKSLGPMAGTLYKGEIVFYEIVGYQGMKTIMPSVGTSVLKDKALKKLYGDTMNYVYGCRPGESKSFIYRIAYVNSDKVLVDMPWDYVKARALELGMQYVPEICQPFTYDGDFEGLCKLVDGALDKPSCLDSKHVEEGVCIRVEQGSKIKVYKQKGFIFSVLEGIIKDQDDYVDIEEVS